MTVGISKEVELFRVGHLVRHRLFDQVVCRNGHPPDEEVGVDLLAK